MKKLLSIVLVIAMMFALAACGGEKTDDSVVTLKDDAALQKASGVTLIAPAEAVDPHYATVELDGIENKVAQADFTFDGNKCVLRKVAGDFSLSTLDAMKFDHDETVEVDGLTVRLRYNDASAAAIASTIAVADCFDGTHSYCAILMQNGTKDNVLELITASIGQ